MSNTGSFIQKMIDKSRFKSQTSHAQRRKGARERSQKDFEANDALLNRLRERTGTPGTLSSLLGLKGLRSRKADR